MEGKQWMLLLLLVVLLVAVSMDLSGYQLQSPLTAGYRSKAQEGAAEKVNGREVIKSSDSERLPIVANLSNCHASLTDAGVPVYCCPIWKDGDQELVDFQFPDPSSPMRIRRPIHKIDDEYRAKYARAVEIMKNLPDDHPHNYRRQANMHCLYCTGAYNQMSSEALYKIHRTWLFFPWHRAFLYFHERILGKLIGDENFSLIYWAWDHPDGMWFPEMFKNGSLIAMQRDPYHFQHAVDDNYARVERNLTDSEQILDNLALMYHQMVSGAKKSELFMGCKLRHGVSGFCDIPGTIEAAPHNTVHSWVGNRNNPEREYMGAFYSAARDPVFFGHHSEIDRMWTVWRRMRGNKHPATEFPDEDWLDTEFTFYDENVRLVRIKVRDVLDHTKLRYKYQDVDFRWLNARPKPSVAPHVARSILKKRHAEQQSLLRMPGSDQQQLEQQGNWTLDKPITVRLERPRVNRTKEEKEEEEEIIYIYGINTKRSSFVKFDVFVNVVEETVLSPRSREFAGTFVDIQHVSRSKDGMKMKSGLKLGISELLEDLEADGDDSIWVTLVPRGDAGSLNTTVEGLRIEYMR
ncbi:polyphenol oxidase I, chloroplastic-like [Canna indica]|uniref:Polyphenol oxidase I, chloroplastic-like n=1 Tax=Canna indica TaxID=4628 RepID=A0AAQ3K708_9LILI|nr:polyphenol oxidase I, chloroplastic-like [Canna indica]